MPVATLPNEPTTSLATRSRRQLALLAFAFFLCLWIVSWFGLLGELEVSIGAQPITLILKGLSAPHRLTATYLTTVGDSDGDQKQFGFVIPHEQLMFPSPGRDTWRIAGHWVKTIHITAPEHVLNALRSAEIRIGDRTQTYTNLTQWRRLSQPLTGLLPNRNEPAVTIELPASGDKSLPAINSVPIGTFVQRLFTFPLIGFGMVVVTAWLLWRFAQSNQGKLCWNALNTSGEASFSIYAPRGGEVLKPETHFAKLFNGFLKNLRGASVPPEQQGNASLAIVGQALAYTPLRGGPKARNSLSFWRACAELQLRWPLSYRSGASSPPLPAGGAEAPRKLKLAPQWFCAGLALAATGLAFLYARYSYPFTQDDNFSQFLPMVLYNCRTLLSGHWPAWNPHQFLGAPVATMGIYSVTYPPLYLAYGLARLAGNEWWTIEIYTLLHLAAGYALLYVLLNKMGIRPAIAATASASFILSGWFLIAGRSQMTFAPLAVWPVAMAWSLHHLAATKRATWTWTILSALSIGLFFHAGHSQMWVYGMMFYVAALGVHLLGRSLRWREAAQAIPAIVMGIGIAAPLLILQAIEGTSSARTGAYGDRIEFLHMLLPLGNLMPRPVGLGTGGFEYFCEMYYSGTLFQALSFVAILLALTRFVFTPGTKAEARQWLGDNAWLVLFALAILFGLGSKGILWTVFAQLPIFDRFRWPIKFAYFCLLYSTLGGAVLAERWFTHKPKLQFPMLAAVACLLLIHVNSSRTSWYDFADRPYPSLPAALQPAVTTPDGRLLTRWGSMDRSPLPGYYNTLPLDFATHAGAYAIGGYDTFLEGSLAARRVRHKFWADPVAAARAYGVKWIAADRMLDHPVASANPFFSLMDASSIGNVLAIHAAQDAGQLTGTGDGLTVHQLSGSDPLAFLMRDRQNALPIQMNSEGVTINTSTARPGDTLICNVAMRPWMKSTVPLEEDEWGRIRLRLTETSPQIAIAYRPPWGSTLLVGFALILAGVAARKLGPRH